MGNQRYVLILVVSRFSCITSGANVSRGIQTGATKVFLRQPAFDSLEKMRNQVLAVESVKIQSVIRRFVYHRRFLRIMHRIVLAQAGARRFLARKHLRSLQQRRAAICIQACVRFFVARKRFVGKRSVALLNQKLYRVYAGRIKYKMLQAKRKEAQRLDNAATIIQSMSRVRVARKVYAKLKLMERQTSVEPPEFQRKVFKETIKAHRKAAVSRQEAMDRAREVDDLTTNLANAKNSAAKAELVIAELESLRAVLAATEAELEKMKEVVATKSNRVTELEGENVLLKEKLESGDSVAGERYDRKIYSEFPDLEKLDRQMLGMVSRSKKSKADVKALVSSLAVLR
jgi:myosin heavy subunit